MNYFAFVLREFVHDRTSLARWKVAAVGSDQVLQMTMKVTISQPNKNQQ